jgi:hypothetical protein
MRRSTPRPCRAGDAACAQWRSALPQLAGISMQACLRAARQLAQLEAAAFASHSQWIDAFPFALGPAYGRVDAQRCRALSRALQHHVIALCDFALDRPHALQGTPAAGQPAPRARAGADRAAKRAGPWARATALAEVLALQQRLGRWASGRCVSCRALPAEPARGAAGRHRARASGAAGRCADSAGADDVVALTAWSEWLAAEGAGAARGARRPSRSKAASKRSARRRVFAHAHRLAQTELGVLPHRDLRVRNSHLVIGPRGGILRPGPWHLSMGDYPYEHRHVRLRGGGIDAIGAVLRPAAGSAWTRRSVVLANQDATYHRNYYHWMLLILARIVGLRDHGLLKGRKLLMPRELSGWMRSSLEAVGITDKQMLLYGDDDDLHLTDALLASPIDFASPSLVEGLRQALWRYAGLDPAAPPEASRLLYISRRGEGRRPLVEEVRIQRAAEAWASRPSRRRRCRWPSRCACSPARAAWPARPARPTPT